VKTSGHRPGVRGRLPGLLGLCLFWALVLHGWAGDDLASRCADRTAVERVYYEHRLGTKPAFEKALPSALIESLVKRDMKKEAVLQHAYGVEITPELVAAEVRRINTTTRAPDVLAELKAALGNAPSRFAGTVARPVVVERILRQRFENDDKLHAPQRREAETVRELLLAARRNGKSLDELSAVVKTNKAGTFGEATWLLTPPPAEAARSAPGVQPAVPSPIKAGSSLYAIEGTAQMAQVLGSPEKDPAGRERELYFDDLNPDLQHVLRVQLLQPADVSAVIEAPHGFMVFLARDKTATALKVISLSIPRRSYEEWLEAQPGNESTRRGADPLAQEEGVMTK
jgi:hypothetical protein